MEERMIIDNKEYKVKYLVLDNKAYIFGKPIPTVDILVATQDESYMIKFYTTVPANYFDKLKVNEKTDVMDMIDSHDIDFVTNQVEYVNTEENSEVYFTKLEDGSYQVNLTINNPLETDIRIYQKDQEPEKRENISKVELNIVINLNN